MKPHVKQGVHAFSTPAPSTGCDLKVLKRSAGGIATRRARPIRFVRVLAAGFAALRAFPSKAALSSAHFRPAPIGLVSLHFDFPFVRGDKSRRSRLCVRRSRLRENSSWVQQEKTAPPPPPTPNQTTLPNFQFWFPVPPRSPSHTRFPSCDFTSERSAVKSAIPPLPHRDSSTGGPLSRADGTACRSGGLRSCATRRPRTRPHRSQHVVTAREVPAPPRRGTSWGVRRPAAWSRGSATLPPTPIPCGGRIGMLYWHPFPPRAPKKVAKIENFTRDLKSHAQSRSCPETRLQTPLPPNRFR